MFDLNIYLYGLAAALAFAFLGWLVSLYQHKVTLVDTMWGPFFLLAITVYFVAASEAGWRARLLWFLVALWGLRLSLYLGWRNRGNHEDRRYQAVRDKNEPHFGFKSLYLVFGFQAFLAWVLSLPLLGGVLSLNAPGWLDAFGVLLWLFGFVVETAADWQLARFKSDPRRRGQVLQQGLWRLSRHPNYFGESCVWWGYYLIACSAGAWWSILAPLLMTWLLLKFSGVVLLEQDIAQRRPAYVDYMRTTPAFFPRPIKKNEAHEKN